MLVATYIYDQNGFLVHKRFHRLILGPLSYLIKAIGIDYDEKNKRQKKGSQNEKVLRGPNEKFAILLCRFLKRNERIRKNKLKKRHYEGVEEAV